MQLVLAALWLTHTWQVSLVSSQEMVGTDGYLVIGQSPVGVVAGVKDAREELKCPSENVITNTYRCKVSRRWYVGTRCDSPNQKWVNFHHQRFSYNL